MSDNMDRPREGDPLLDDTPHDPQPLDAEELNMISRRLEMAESVEFPAFFVRRLLATVEARDRRMKQAEACEEVAWERVAELKEAQEEIAQLGSVLEDELFSDSRIPDIAAAGARDRIMKRLGLE